MSKSNLQQASSTFSLNKLFIAVAAQTLLAAASYAGPTGGNVVGGSGSISNSAGLTRIDQNSSRLAVEWDTFNVNSGERVQFVQPSADAIALNRILDNSPSSILGRIDANGRIILSNPNGITFGSGSTVNVQSLIASGLDIDSGEFMAGELNLSGVDGTNGVVISQGIINAATGGNVALIGKRVSNAGAIKATLGRVALASGEEAVLTFDDAGLLGVRVDEAALQADGVFAVTNTGTLKAEGGQVLLTASTSEDLFSAAVNHGHLNGNVEAIVHDDGSFSIGSGGGNISSQGTINVSTGAGSAYNAGQVIVAGEKVWQKGAIRANAQGGNLAGDIEIQAVEKITLSNPAVIEAVNSSKTSGRVKLQADSIQATGDSKILTSGNSIVSATMPSVLPQTRARHGYIKSIDKVTQNGGMKLSGNLHLDVLADANVNLSHTANDFNSISADSKYRAVIKIVDPNDVVLGNLNLGDTSLSVASRGANGTISQAGGSFISLGDSDLALKADNIVLGTGGSGTGGANAIFTIDFAKSVNTNNSIALETGDHIYHNVAITGTSDGSKAVTLTGVGPVNMAAQIDGDSLVIGNMTGANATLGGLFETTQTGAITLSDTLTWNSYKADLTHIGNDVGALAGSGAIAFGSLNYVDRNDVGIKNLNTSGPTENEVSITSVGAGATIRQLPGTVLAADFITLNADNIELGAGGTSAVSAGYMMDVDFGRNFLLDGSLSVGGYAPYLGITGSDAANNFTITENANTSFFGEGAPLAVLDVDLGAGNDTATFDGGIYVDTYETDAHYSFDMGAGNDRVNLNNHVFVPITLGAGNDHVQEWEHGTIYELVDFNGAEDTYDIDNP